MFFEQFLLYLLYIGEFLTHKFIKICVINSCKTLYIVAKIMQKKILRFSQTFLQKVIAISQIICYNSKARVE